MEEKNMRLTFINVGYGEAMVLECPDASRPGGVFTALIDGGGAEEAEFAGSTSGRLPVAEYLKRRDIRRIDLAVSTHVHEDHLCGLLCACRAAPPDALWQALPPDFYRTLRPLDVSAARTASESKFLRALNDYRTLCALAEGGISAPPEGVEQALCPGLRARVLSPDATRREELAAAMTALYAKTEGTEAFYRELDALDARMNNFSLILRLDYFGTRLLLPGDTNLSGYGGIDPAELRADIFKIGHHGQKDGADAALLQAVRPQAAVCCASSDRRYESAHPAAMQLLADFGAKRYFSDCPPVSGVSLEPHQALQFTIGPGGVWDAQYLSGI